MTPAFLPDDYVISIGWWLPVRRLWRALAQRPLYRVNDVLLIQHRTYGRIIKRVTAVQDTNSSARCVCTYMLTGDNRRHSVSSAEIGSIPEQQVIGKVFAHIRKPR